MKELCIILIILFALALLVAGCQEQQRKIYGQGNIPLDWQVYFGNDNIARLDYMQTRAINQQGQTLTELAERVRKLETAYDPNKFNLW